MGPRGAGRVRADRGPARVLERDVEREVDQSRINVAAGLVGAAREGAVALDLDLEEAEVCGRQRVRHVDLDPTRQVDVFQEESAGFLAVGFTVPRLPAELGDGAVDVSWVRAGAVDQPRHIDRDRVDAVARRLVADQVDRVAEALAVPRVRRGDVGVDPAGDDVVSLDLAFAVLGDGIVDGLLQGVDQVVRRVCRRRLVKAPEHAAGSNLNGNLVAVDEDCEHDLVGRDRLRRVDWVGPVVLRVTRVFREVERRRGAVQAKFLERGILPAQVDVQPMVDLNRRLRDVEGVFHRRRVEDEARSIRLGLDERDELQRQALPGLALHRDLDPAAVGRRRIRGNIAVGIACRRQRVRAAGR